MQSSQQLIVQLEPGQSYLLVPCRNPYASYIELNPWSHLDSALQTEQPAYSYHEISHKHCTTCQCQSTPPSPPLNNASFTHVNQENNINHTAPPANDAPNDVACQPHERVDPLTDMEMFRFATQLAHYYSSDYPDIPQHCELYQARSAFKSETPHWTPKERNLAWKKMSDKQKEKYRKMAVESKSLFVEKVLRFCEENGLSLSVVQRENLDVDNYEEIMQEAEQVQQHECCNEESNEEKIESSNEIPHESDINPCCNDTNSPVESDINPCCNDTNSSVGTNLKHEMNRPLVACQSMPIAHYSSHSLLRRCITHASPFVITALQEQHDLLLRPSHQNTPPSSSTRFSPIL